MTESHITSFIDLPPSDFPLHIEAFDIDTGVTLWERKVNGPSAIEIPSKPEHVRRVGIYIVYGDSSTQVEY